MTQGIQNYRIDMRLVDPLDRASGNMARIIADKAAWVRVYFRSSSLKDIANITGDLRMERYLPNSFQIELKQL